jgi:hypothetical protein
MSTTMTTMLRALHHPAQVQPEAEEHELEAEVVAQLRLAQHARPLPRRRSRPQKLLRRVAARRKPPRLLTKKRKKRQTKSSISMMMTTTTKEACS